MHELRERARLGVEARDDLDPIAESGAQEFDRDGSPEQRIVAR
jgi:hypothetical protein